MDFIAMVLASGFSKRFGEDKLLYELKDGFTLIDHVFNAIELCNFKAKIVVTNNREIISEAISRSYIPVINEDPSEGKARSIRLGTELAKTIDPDAHLMFFVADAPNISMDLIMALQEEAEFNIDKIICPKYMDRLGNPVIFPPKYYEALMALTGEEGGMKIAKENMSLVYTMDIDDEALLMDIDTKEDLIN